MADEPFRLRLMKKITSVVKSVNPGNDYTFDLSDYVDSAGRTAERVHRGKDEFGDNDKPPVVGIFENPNNLVTHNDPANSTTSANEFKLVLMGFVEEDKAHPLDPAYKLSAEIISALVKEKLDRFDILGFGHRMPCVTSMAIGQPIHRPPDGVVSSLPYFVIPLTLHLVENLESPFA